jgi:hypothetical protein
MRCLKNDALSAKRRAEKKSAECEKLQADNRRLRALVGGIEYKRPRQKPCTATEYEQQVQGLQGDVSKLTDELEEAGEALRNVLAENERKGLTNPFITLVGMKGDEYSQDMVELGLKMMS